MSSKIQTYAELQRMIRKALREQHPEWIGAGGKCTLCDPYEVRFARLLRLNKNYEPAQQNMRRIYELFQFGSSKEPFNLGES